MGRDLHASREIEGIIEYATQTVSIPFYVSSTYRPDAITLSGNLSNHALRRAVDFTAAHTDGTPKATIDSSELFIIYEAFLLVAADLNELIHCGPNAKNGVKHRKLVPPYACSIHHNHVHVAVDTGIYLPEYLTKPRASAPTGNPVTPQEVKERTDMPTAVMASRMQGGYALLQTRDGGVFNYNSPFFGSMVNIAPGPFVAFTWTLSGKGYWILDALGAVFSFGDASYQGGVNEGPLKEHFGNRVPVGMIPYEDGTYDIIGQDLSGDSSPFDSYHCKL